MEHIVPLLVGKDQDDIIKRAKMTENGKLTKTFAYLQEFVDEK